MAWLSVWSEVQTCVCVCCSVARADHLPTLSPIMVGMVLAESSRLVVIYFQFSVHRGCLFFNHNWPSERLLSTCFSPLTVL